MILSVSLQAQDDLFITVSASATTTNVTFTTVSSPIASPSAPKSVKEEPPLLVISALKAAEPIASEKHSVEKWEQELLRDPFWPVGFFPEGWQTKSVDSGDDGLDGSGWKAASAKLRISGTSQLGGRTAAIINGALKSAGDPVEVLYEGKTYQWQIIEIDINGRVQLKKTGIR
jgi:hypothetical protein